MPTNPGITGIAGYWDMNDLSGDALDISAHGETLAAKNAPGSTTGTVGNARTLASVSAQYFRRESVGLQVGSGDFTCSTWFRPNTSLASSSFGGRLFQRRGTGGLGNPGWSLWVMKSGTNMVLGRLYMENAAAAAVDVQTTPTLGAIGAWTLVSLVVDRTANTAKIYGGATAVQTTSIATLTTGSLSSAAGRGFTIGGADLTQGQLVDGDVDESVLYVGRALTGDEIAYLAEGHTYADLVGPSSSIIPAAQHHYRQQRAWHRPDDSRIYRRRAA
jgi:hypothetical protein